MRKLVVVVFVTMFGFSLAYAQSDTSDLRTIITSNFPDNVAGFITPERLRNVSLDLMRSNANLLEDNLMTGKLQVNDSVKTLDAFYTWNGSAWVEVGSDPSVWSRSGGFILPSTYTDKLSIDSARFGGVIYPNDATVNIGTSTAPFDTVFADVIVGVSGNSLDQAYDAGGAGVGRTITADAGNVEVVGNIESDMVLTDSINGSNGVLNLQTNGVNRLTMDANGNTFAQKEDGTGILFMGINEIDSVLTATATLFEDYARVGWVLDGRSFAAARSSLIDDNISDLQLADDGLKLGASDSNRWGKFWIEHGQRTRVSCEQVGSPLVRSDLYVDTSHIELVTDTLRLSIGGAAENYVLTSDASGNASWNDPSAWGEMGFADSSHTLALTQNVPAWVTNTGNDIWSVAAVTMRNVTYSNDSLIVNTGGAGTYFISGHLSVEGLNGSAIKAYTYLNGSIACSCVAVETLENNDIVTVDIACDIIPLSEGDALTIWVENTANNDDVDLISGKLTIHKIGQ